MDYQTISYDLREHVATVTLNRPDRLNAFNRRMCDEFEHLWGAARLDDDVRVVVLQAEGERAFSTGIDVREGLDRPQNVWSQRGGPGRSPIRQMEGLSEPDRMRGFPARTSTPLLVSHSGRSPASARSAGM